MKQALLLSAYDATSHRRWREQVVEFVPFDWRVETLPPRHFSWRYRGNALSFGLGDLPDQPFDVVLATSATNLAPLLGLRPNLRAANVVVYFHENQFAYPSRTSSGVDPHLAIQEVLTAAAADRVVFNSEWNRESFFEGASAFLKMMPDAVPRGVLESIDAKSTVLPVPVSPPEASHVAGDGPLRLVWNHRWEHDKGPDALLEMCRGLAEVTDQWELAVVGQRFRDVPNALIQLESEFADKLTQYGWLESRTAYLQLLQRSDVVVSTAEHEFQGIAVIEALMCGCRAWVPDALAYPEYVPNDQRWSGAPAEAGRGLARFAERRAALDELEVPDLSRFKPASLAERYRELLDA